MACPVPHPPCGAPKPDCERSVSGLFRDGRAVARRRGGAFLPIHGMPRPIHGMESRFHGVFPRFHGMFPADPWPVSCGKCGRLPHELPSPPLKTPQNAAAARSVGRRRRGKRRFVRSIWFILLKFYQFSSYIFCSISILHSGNVFRGGTRCICTHIRLHRHIDVSSHVSIRSSKSHPST